jgi:hypothetical protein
MFPLAFHLPHCILKKRKFVCTENKRMKKLIALLPVLILLALACNKDKFTSVPQVKIKSLSPKDRVVQRDIVELTGDFTDEEGDLDSVLVVYKWYNGTAVVRNDTFRYDLTALNLPAATRQGDIEVKFQFASFEPYTPPILTLPNNNQNKDTTASLGLVVIDKKKQRSEYAESDKVRLIRP